RRYSAAIRHTRVARPPATAPPAHDSSGWGAAPARDFGVGDEVARAAGTSAARGAAAGQRAAFLRTRRNVAGSAAAAAAIPRAERVPERWRGHREAERPVTSDEARRLFAAACVARLATADATGRPHLVPITFAVAGDRIYSAVDAKPKRTTALRRLANVTANPRVAALVDHYEDDWRRLWWVRADGTGRVLASHEAEARDAVALLVARYAPYVDSPPTGPVLAIDVQRWSGWSAAGHNRRS
ncbi:MAG: TIGR03668 family PPOX class F420-dependent oxidoreductase, partial [Egibacteraceae bacterium]